MAELRRAWLWTALELVLAGSLFLVPAVGHAQIAPTDEYSKLIAAGRSIQPMGTHPFGESINLYNGSLSFEVTDVSVPGIGPVLQLSRSLDDADPTNGGFNRERPFGEWHLDIPRMETMTAFQGSGSAGNGSASLQGWWVWTSGVSGHLDRCTQFRAPPPAQSSQDYLHWDPTSWWYGYFLIVPGEGSQYVGSGFASTINGVSYSLGTKKNWRIGCGVTASDGGEGFLAVAPDGTRYTFNHLIYRPATSLERTDPLPPGDGGEGFMDVLTRRDGLMYVTKIEDRFGNTLTYNWSSNDPSDPVNNHLTSIVASDGRELDLAYYSGTTPQLIHTVTVKAAGGASARTWTYSYDTSGNEPTLTKVQLPDGSAWTYQLGNLYKYSLQTDGASCPSAPGAYSIGASGGTGNVTAPSGLTATFTVTPMFHGRSYVPQQCNIDIPGGNPPQDYFPITPDLYGQFSLTKEVLSGPGIPTATWTWSYSSPNASWTTDSCASSKTCPTTVYTDVTDPLGHDVRYTFSNHFDFTEGQLLRTNSYSGAADSTDLRSVVNAYADPSGQSWPTAGDIDVANVNFAQIDKTSPLQKRVITLITPDAATFTTLVNAFDSFARATSTTGSSSLGYSKTDTKTYFDDVDNWVLGLVTQTTTAGIVDSQTSYNNLDQPASHCSFGRLVSTSAWNSNGTLASVTEGGPTVTSCGSAFSGGRTTFFSNWYRGVPEEITYDYGTDQATTQRATVNGNGWITSVTDENGFTTGYGYDAMGRLASITYPAQSGETWNSTILSFTPKGAGQYNTPVGAWVQTVQTGNDVTNTFFDAFWRPLVTEHYDAGDKSDTISQMVTRYDAAGRTIFTSYPTNNLQSYATAAIGTHTAYDPLNRVTEVDQDWDLDSQAGLLPTKTTYLPGFKTEVTLPNGVNTATTTSYMAYGEPTRQWPVSITAPEGEVTTIHRDVFGKPTSIVRTGSPNQIRSFAYNAYQQLCGRTEPETGSTMFGYDGAGNLVWSVPGMPATSGCYTDSQAANSGRMVSRTYDGRNRLTGIIYPGLTYPDGFSTTSYQYAPDGALLVQSVANDGFPVTTYYSYDERRLLTSEQLCFSAPPCAPNALTFTLGYGYDANGHLKETTYPDARPITYAPNALGQPTEAVSPTVNYATNVKYFPNGTIASFNYGSGALYTASEDTRGLVSRDADTLNGTAAMDLAYDYDGDGNVAAISDNLSSHVGNVDMTYDGLDRLREADSPMFGGTVTNPGKALYGYDVFDNLTSASVGNRSSFVYGYNYAQNQLIKLTDAYSGTTLATYSYDAQGNLAKKDSQAYQFDMADRLASVPGLATYRYDAAGRRVQKVETGAGTTTDSDYSRAGNLMYQWNPANANSTDYIYLGSTLVSRVVGNNSSVTGWINGVTSGSTPAVWGWACSTDIPTPISVEVFVGGPSGGGGIRIATATANQASGADVAQACGTTGTTYAFSIPISSTDLTQYVGELIYMYGDSPVGNGNNELQGSGTYSVPPNPNAPSAPASISVPASSSTGAITVSWAAATKATSYLVQQQLNGGSWGQVYEGSGTSISLSGLDNGTYVYRVHACDSSGCSLYTTSSSLKVALIPAAPASINVPSTSYSPSIPVSWSSSANATNYVLEESFNGGSWGVVPGVGDTTSFTVSVSSSGTYQFRVSACGEGGCSADFTTSGDVVVTLPPASPSLSGPSASNNGTFTLSWSGVSGATRYQLNQNLNGTVTTPYNSTGTSWTSSNLGNGTYNYQVFACNVAGCSGSTIISVVVTHPPASAPSLSGPSSSSTGTYTLSWSAVATATRYQVNQSINGGTWTAAYNGTARSWSSSNVGNGSYAYRVYAWNVGGWGPPSNQVTVTVLHPPAAPSLSGPSSSVSGSFSLSWTAVSGATRYQLNQNLNGTVTTPYNSTGTSWSSSNLGNGTYSYEVYACNGGGCTGSNGIAVKVLHIPAAPPYMTAPDMVPYPGNRWSISIAASSGATSYNLRRTNTGTGAATVMDDVGTSATDYITPGTYQYAAQACNASGCSGWRNAGNATTVFCAENSMTVQGSVSPDVMKCGGLP